MERLGIVNKMNKKNIMDLNNKLMENNHSFVLSRSEDGRYSCGYIEVSNEITNLVKGVDIEDVINSLTIKYLTGEDYQADEVSDELYTSYLDEFIKEGGKLKIVPNGKNFNAYFWLDKNSRALEISAESVENALEDLNLAFYGIVELLP